jgi:fumarate reductase subunit D
MSTVGYGDMSPSTHPGRVIAMCIAFTGSFLISIVVVTVLSLFELNHPQKMALRHIRLTRSAAKTITASMRYFMIKKQLHMVQEHNLPKTSKSQFMTLFRKLQKQAKIVP